MIYTANQTLYFPCVYMMARFDLSDTLVFMTEAQFTKFGHQSRAEIKTKNGDQLLVLPLKNRSFRPLDEIEVDNPEKWVRKLKTTITTVYGKYEGYKELHETLFQTLDYLLEQNRNRGSITAADVGMAVTQWSMMACGLTTDINVTTSKKLLDVRPEDPSEWVAELGAKCEASTYLGGRTAMSNYVRYDSFKERDISLMHQEFKMLPYTDVGGNVNTNAWTSILDPLMVGGSELGKTLVRNSQSSMVRTKPEECSA